MKYDGIVLAGGAARRLGGISKPAVTVGGRQLIDIAVDALSGAATTIVVGAQMPTSRPVVWTREDPVGGGPVAALAAALQCATAPAVVVLAADLPFVTRDAIEQLLQHCDTMSVALAVDQLNRDQPLLACYNTKKLRAAIPLKPQGASMRSVMRELEWLGPIARVTLDGDRPITLDCDTAADLSHARDLV